MIFIIKVFDIEWVITSNAPPAFHEVQQFCCLPTEHIFSVVKEYSSVKNFMDMFGVEWDDDLISDLLSDKEGFCVKSFDFKIELEDWDEEEEEKEVKEEDSLPMEYYEEEEEGISEGIPPEQLPEIPFPPPKVPKGKWEEGCDTEEREEEITMEFVKYYKLPSIDAIKYFVDNYKGDNEAMPIIKRLLNSNDDTLVYNSFIKIMENPMDEEKCKEVGENIYMVLLGTGEVHIHMEAMRSVFYLVSWYFESSNNMCIKAYPRVLEHYWNGIGEWLA